MRAELGDELGGDGSHAGAGERLGVEDEEGGTWGDDPIADHADDLWCLPLDAPGGRAAADEGAVPLESGLRRIAGSGGREDLVQMDVDDARGGGPDVLVDLTDLSGVAWRG